MFDAGLALIIKEARISYLDFGKGLGAGLLCWPEVDKLVYQGLILFRVWPRLNLWRGVWLYPLSHQRRNFLIIAVKLWQPEKVKACRHAVKHLAKPLLLAFHDRVIATLAHAD